MAATELTERDITKKMLEDAANDMSAVMKFEDAIPTGKKIVKAAIQADVIEAAAELRAEDTLKPKTVEVLIALGVEMVPAEEESKVEASTETVPATGEPKSSGPENAPTSEKKAEKVKTEKGLSRVQAICQILRETENGIDFESLSTQSDALYARNGKKPNMVANNREVAWVIQCLDAAGVLNETEGKYSL